MDNPTASFLTLAACAIAAIILVVLRQRDASIASVRLRELDEARQAIATLAQHMQVFMDDPASPPSLRAVLLEAANFPFDHDRTAAVARALLAHPPLVADESTCQILGDLDDLERSHRVLARRFVVAIECAFYGAVLRWPDTAMLFAKLRINLQSDTTRQEVVVLAKAAVHDRPVLAGQFAPA